MNQFDSSYPKKATPNRIINIIDEIRPLLEEIKVAISKREYADAISKFERLEQQHGFIVTDMIRISEAYINTGKLAEAEAFLEKVRSRCKEETNMDSILAQVDFILGQIQGKQFTHARLIEEVKGELLVGRERFNFFTKLSENFVDNDTELSEYYIYMALTDFDRVDFIASEFQPLMHLLNNYLENATLRIAKQLKRVNEITYRAVSDAFPIEYSRILLLNELPVKEVVEPESLEEVTILSMNHPTVADFLQSFFDQLLPEEATFAYATA